MSSACHSVKLVQMLCHSLSGHKLSHGSCLWSIISSISSSSDHQYHPALDLVHPSIHWSHPISNTTCLLIYSLLISPFICLTHFPSLNTSHGTWMSCHCWHPEGHPSTTQEIECWHDSCSHKLRGSKTWSCDLIMQHKRDAKMNIHGFIFAGGPSDLVSYLSGAACRTYTHPSYC